MIFSAPWALVSLARAEQGHSIQGMQDVPVLAAKPRFTDEEWKRLAEGLNRLGERAREKDMTLTYHHHMGTGGTDRCGGRPADGNDGSLSSLSPV